MRPLHYVIQRQKQRYKLIKYLQLIGLFLCESFFFRTSINNVPGTKFSFQEDSTKYPVCKGFIHLGAGLAVGFSGITADSESGGWWVEYHLRHKIVKSFQDSQE
uniref:Uncharacterized protein n=1 Tax=Cacopsylla melanoneura TaxID=428564 RepID=A0A8D9F9J8_9HEMI